MITLLLSRYELNNVERNLHQIKQKKKKSGKIRGLVQGSVVQSIVSLTSSLRVISLTVIVDSMPASVAQLDVPSDWRPGGRGFNPCRGRQHSFVEIDHEIFSTVILSLPLIQEGQLSVSGERMCTLLVNRLED